jgi:Flp pilus assembly CpaF family ATPase
MADFVRKAGPLNLPEGPGSIQEGTGGGPEGTGGNSENENFSPCSSASGSWGWNIVARNSETEIDAGRGVEENGSFCIVSLPGGQKGYWLGAFPVFSRQEERLLATVSALFQKREGRSGKRELRAFFKEYCLQNLVMLGARQVCYLGLALEKQIFGFGPLDFFLGNDELEEIAVVGIGRGKPVFVFHCRHGWLATNVFFSCESAVRDLVNRMARPVGRRLSMNSPIVNATLPDGNRLSAAISPVSFSGPSLTLRKFRKEPFTPVQLLENGTFSAELMAFLWIAMQCDCSVLVVGNTGSGKTSSLNALLSFVPAGERLVLVEETPEIRVQHRHFVKLSVVKEQAVGMQGLIVESLRMRPDRIIVGEVRSREEVSAFIDTLLAGQGKGSYATFHGQSVRETIGRMRSLGVLETDLAAIDLVLVQRRWNCMSGKEENKEIRRVVEVAELDEKNGCLGCNVLFRQDYGCDCLRRVNESEKVFGKARQGFSFGRQGFKAELEKRARFLEGLKGSRARAEEFFRKANDF